MNADKLADALRTILDHVDGYVPNTPKAIWRDAQAALAEHDAQPAQSAQPVASTHGFRFVDVKGDGYAGCINLFWGQMPITMVYPPVATEIRQSLIEFQMDIAEPFCAANGILRNSTSSRIARDLRDDAKNLRELDIELGLVENMEAAATVLERATAPIAFWVQDASGFSRLVFDASEYRTRTDVQFHITPLSSLSIAGLSEGGLVRGVGDVDKGVPASASGAQKEASVVVDVGLDSGEHDLKTTVLAGPHGGKSTPYVPEGWVLVPREPTKQMLAAEDDAVPPKESFDDGGDPFAWGRVSWSAMLAAAPQPPAQPSADAEVSNEMVLRAVHASLDWPHPLTHFEARKALEAAMAKESDAARAAEGGE